MDYVQLRTVHYENITTETNIEKHFPNRSICVALLGESCQLFTLEEVV